ncbi:MAG: NUDIX domain-containing protein [bacterium]|nr:NUDIX domain-containing protein [bacterium]
MPGIFGCAVEPIVEKNGLILIGQRSWTLDHAPGEWETLTGRVEKDETFEDAAKREIKEEVGLEIEVVKPYGTFHFYRGPGKVEHLGVSFWCKYISGEVVLDTNEQIDFKWLTPDEAIKLIKNENIKTSLQKFKEVFSHR